jgi:glycerophosphoryl diester phosphodiesterase
MCSGARTALWWCSTTPGQLAELASWADQVDPDRWSVEAAYVSAVHAHRMACLVWTVNRAGAMRHLLDLGVTASSPTVLTCCGL